MPNLNKVLLAGHLTRDPEIRYVGDNTAVANIGLATSRKYRTRDGEMKEEVAFVDCEAWGKQAETIGQYFTKGKPIFIEGRLVLDQWQDQQGNNRSKLKVRVSEFSFFGGSRDGDGGAKPDKDDPVEDEVPF